MPSSLVGRIAFRQYLDTPALSGLGLIVAGLVVINGFLNIAGR